MFEIIIKMSFFLAFSYLIHIFMNQISEDYECRNEDYNHKSGKWTLRIFCKSVIIVILAFLFETIYIKL